MLFRSRPIEFTFELTEEVTLSRREAKALAMLRQDLDLSYVEFLSTEAAEELAKHQGIVMKFNGVPVLGEGAAQGLAKYEGELIQLNGIRFLSPGAAEHLREYQGLLELLGLEQISPKVAEILGNCRGRMRIGVQEPLSDAAALPLVDNNYIWIDARMSPGMEKYCNLERCYGHPTQGP